MPRTKPVDTEGTYLDALTEKEADELRDELPKLMHKIEQLEAVKREASQKLRDEIQAIRERVSVVTQALLTKKIRRPAQRELPLSGGRGGKKQRTGESAG